MKKLYYPLISALLLFMATGCGKSVKPNEFVIKGMITNAPANAQLLVFDLTQEKTEPLAKADIKDGKFSLSGVVSTKGFYSVGLSKTNATLVILGGEKINLTAEASDLKNSAEVSESVENKSYKQFNAMLLEYEKNLKPLYTEARNAADGMDAQGMPISAERRKEIQLSLQQRVDKMNSDREAQIKTFTKDDNLLVSLVAKMYINPTFDKNKPENQKYKNNNAFYAEHFFDDIPVTNPSLAYIPEFGYKIRGYLQLHGYDETAITTLQNMIQKASTPKVKEAIYRPAIAVAEQTNEELFMVLGEMFKKDFPQSNLVPTLDKRMADLAKFKVGATIPEIALNNANNQGVKLSALKGKVVLVDFWASWCAPCRGENPNVKKMYDLYKRKGFEVFGVSTDKKADEWKKAIKEDGITWIQTIDTEGVVSQQFNIRTIPATFLIDKNGVIVAKNLRGERLEKKLAELLGAA